MSRLLVRVSLPECCSLFKCVVCLPECCGPLPEHMTSSGCAASPPVPASVCVHLSPISRPGAERGQEDNGLVLPGGLFFHSLTHRDPPRRTPRPGGPHPGLSDPPGLPCPRPTLRGPPLRPCPTLQAFPARAPRRGDPHPQRPQARSCGTHNRRRPLPAPRAAPRPTKAAFFPHNRLKTRRG